jgi:hypothetical protein
MENNYELIINEKSDLVDDYFIFELDDIELFRLSKLYEEKLTKEEAMMVKDDLLRFICDFNTNPFCGFSFPYMKNTILPQIEKQFVKYNNKDANLLYLTRLLGNRNSIMNKLKEFYTHTILQNNFGISTNISNAITKEARDSKEYNNFVKMLAEWYTITEMIICYISLQNLFLMKKDVFVFESNNYSPESNFNFSMSSFAKRNLLKLVSYICKNSHISTGTLDFDKMFILLLSAITCGITFKNFFVGIRSCYFLVRMS